MTTRERIYALIDTIPEGDLEELYNLVRAFADAHKSKQGMAIMERLLAGPRIDAPPDFAENIDEYTSGEKSIEDNLP